MLLWQREDGEAFGDVVLEPVGEAVDLAPVGADQAIEFFLCSEEAFQIRRSSVPIRLRMAALGAW
jgi:hypothetical protein